MYPGVLLARSLVRGQIPNRRRKTHASWINTEYVKSRANQSLLRSTPRDTTLRSSSTRRLGTAETVGLPAPARRIGRRTAHTRPVTPVSPRQTARARPHGRTGGERTRDNNSSIAPPSRARTLPARRAVARTQSTPRARPAAASRFPGIPGAATYARARHPGGVFLSLLVRLNSQPATARARVPFRAEERELGASVSS